MKKPFVIAQTNGAFRVLLHFNHSGIPGSHWMPLAVPPHQDRRSFYSSN